MTYKNILQSNRKVFQNGTEKSQFLKFEPVSESSLKQR